MGDPAGSIYLAGGPSRIPHPRQQRSSPREHSILPHFLAPLPCESHPRPYLPADENHQNISVQFVHSCPGQDTAQLDPDILQRHVLFDDGSNTTTLVAYPESSQRTTSHSLSPYPAEADFRDYSSPDLAPLHAAQAFRSGSWPSHSQIGYSLWTQSPPRIATSPVSEPPESTSDESHQSSDVEEATQMSPMMSQIQIQSSRCVDLPPQRAYHAPAPQPSLLTLQFSQSVLQPVDDPENADVPRVLPDMNIVTDDESELTHRSTPSSFLIPVSVPSMSQGPSMRLQHRSEQTGRPGQFHVTVPSPKQQKKAKMHQCHECKKMFPRPSGLATHMNTHSGAKPFKCIVPNCEKTFAVRSNAKRHLRIHGIIPSLPEALSGPRFTVGFEAPMVTQVHDMGKQPSKYRWIPHNPSPDEHEWPPPGSSMTALDSVSRSGITFQASVSSSTTSAPSSRSDDEYVELGPAGAASTRRSHGDRNNRDTSANKFSGTYPIYGEWSRGG